MPSVMIQEKDAGLPLQLNLVFQDPMLLEKKQHMKARKTISFCLTVSSPILRSIWRTSKYISFIVTKGFLLSSLI